MEEGQKVTAGTPLGKVAQPSHLKAELKIAETQVKDITIGQPAVIDTRLAGGGSNGLIEGHVSRIEPSIINGTVTVDVALKGQLPPGARPDLSVDGTIQMEKLDDVVYRGAAGIRAGEQHRADFQDRAGRQVCQQGEGDLRPQLGEYHRDQERPAAWATG